MIDWTSNEDEMMREAGKSGGQYLDSIGITDLRALDKGEWLIFLRAIIGRYGELRVDKPLDDEIPF